MKNTKFYINTLKVNKEMALVAVFSDVPSGIKSDPYGYDYYNAMSWEGNAGEPFAFERGPMHDSWINSGALEEVSEEFAMENYPNEYSIIEDVREDINEHLSKMLYSDY